MSAVWSTPSQDLRSAVAANAPSAAPLSTLVYRSRAAEPIAPLELQRLVLAAQARNRAESITGLLVHEDGHFFQWLEGPTDSVSRVWHSIRNDTRHTEIEIVGDSPTVVRLFSSWNLKLAERHGQAMVGLSPEALVAAPGVMGLLGSLSTAAPFAKAMRDPGDVTPSVLLRRIVTEVAIPRLLARHAPVVVPLPLPLPLPLPSSRVAELAGLLVAVDPTAAFALLSSLHGESESLASLCASVLEPSARRLGDLWSSDDCSAVDVTIGMSRLQTALRYATSDRPAPVILSAQPGVVLIAATPGEPHILGSALDAELLWNAGWNTQCEYPATDHALQNLLAGTWFDALDLSMSLAFRHDDRLGRMAETIRQARSASRNPNLRIVVGGRVFFEQSEAGMQVGADASSASAMQIAGLIPVPVRPDGQSRH